MDSPMGSVITERWSGHLVIEYGIPNKSGRCEGGIIESLEPEISSIWDDDTARSYRPSYGFRKGNLLFTTIPPQCGINKLSEKLAGGSQTFPRAASKHIRSHNSLMDNKSVSTQYLSGKDSVRSEFESFDTIWGGDGSLKRQAEPYKKRCRSTCSITLSCDDKKSLGGRDHQRYDQRSNSSLGFNREPITDTGPGYPWLLRGNEEIYDEDDFRGKMFTSKFSTNVLKGTLKSSKLGSDDSLQSKESMFSNMSKRKSNIIPMVVHEEFEKFRQKDKTTFGVKTKSTPNLAKISREEEIYEGVLKDTRRPSKINMNPGVYQKQVLAPQHFEYRVVEHKVNYVTLQRPSSFVRPTFLKCLQATGDVSPDGAKINCWSGIKNEFSSNDNKANRLNKTGFTNEYYQTTLEEEPTKSSDSYATDKTDYPFNIMRTYIHDNSPYDNDEDDGYVSAVDNSSTEAMFKRMNVKPNQTTSDSSDKTDFSTKAQKFGPLTKLFKKSDHHVGPAKNADCSCSSCRWHFQEEKMRSRSFSVGRKLEECWPMC